MADKKLTTAEILAMARKQAGDSAGTDAPTPAPTEPPAAPAAEASAPPVTPAPAPAAPKSTADILAAARAQAATKGADPAPAAAPKSTADILAAARAQGAKPAAPPAAPKSTADILAAARAQKGAATPAAAKPAATATGSAPTAASAPAGLAVKEMAAAVKQAQEGKPIAAPRLPTKAATPKLPAKEKMPRRTFASVLAAITITPFALAWGSLSAVAGLWTLAGARFLMPNMVRELPSKFKVGTLSDFPPGAVSEKYTASRGIWIVNTDQYNGKPLLYALVSVCTHLGCTPSWLSGEQKFKCPCHGSGFYITGINFEGPAPRPLERAGLALGPDGLLEVDKSLKFQEELGQWSDAKSFVEVG